MPVHFRFKSYLNHTIIYAHTLRLTKTDLLRQIHPCHCDILQELLHIRSHIHHEYIGHMHQGCQPNTFFFLNDNLQTFYQTFLLTYILHNVNTILLLGPKQELGSNLGI